MGNYHARCGAGEKSEVATPEIYLSLFGKIPEFPQKISTCRKYNISTTIVLQSIAQIKMLYKDDYETIIGNCDTAICLGTNEQTTADYFSKKLGKSTITSRSKSTQVGKSGGSLSFNQTGRELMTPDEIMTMPFDECIIMMNHISPFYDKKYPLETHPQFQYTGDGNKNNFYFIEKDEAFLCVDNTLEYNEEAIKDNLDDMVYEKCQPKTLAEVLDNLLVNIPETDGYYLIQDVDSSARVSLFSKEKEKLNSAIKDCIAKQYKTVFYDAASMDIALMKPFVTRVMNEYGDQINDVILVCEDVSSQRYLCCVGAKDDECNAIQLINKLKLTSKKEEGSMFSLYDITSSINISIRDLLEIGCQKGQAAVLSYNDDDDDDYMDM